MRHFPPKTVKLVLILHFIFLALWLGGVMSTLPLIYRADINNFNSVYPAYLHMREIAWNVIGWGGIGSFFTGLILAVFTPWGLFRHKWVAAKFILVIALILFGMFFNEHRILSNIELLETLKHGALNNSRFVSYHYSLQVGLGVSISGFVLAIVIAVFKPWMKKRSVSAD